MRKGLVCYCYNVIFSMLIIHFVYCCVANVKLVCWKERKKMLVKILVCLCAHLKGITKLFVDLIPTFFQRYKVLKLCYVQFLFFYFLSMLSSICFRKNQSPFFLVENKNQSPQNCTIMIIFMKSTLMLGRLICLNQYDFNLLKFFFSIEMIKVLFDQLHISRLGSVTVVMSCCIAVSLLQGK